MGTRSVTSRSIARGRSALARRGPGHGVPAHWRVSRDEVDAPYPCEHLAGGVPVRLLTRGVDAPAATAFRWLCQLRVAPYSYDWIDNGGRRSPRVLTPGLDRLAEGQFFGVGSLASFVEDEHITLRATAAARRWFGLVAMTYQVSVRSSSTSRLVVRLVVEEPARDWERVRYHLLAWGDLLMVRKQLATLKSLADRTDSGPVRFASFSARGGLGSLPSGPSGIRTLYAAGRGSLAPS